MPGDTVICRVEELTDGTSRGFAFEKAERHVEGFLIRRGPAIFAYENRCPHKGTPLDWMPDRFLSADGSHIVCATHGAQFRIEDGYCFGGPCAGAYLKAIAVTIRSGAVIPAV
jgi:nitrite reductase/ring-hydroxylating ferredoxin subunit